MPGKLAITSVLDWTLCPISQGSGLGFTHHKPLVLCLTEKRIFNHWKGLGTHPSTTPSLALDPGHGRFWS